MERSDITTLERTAISITFWTILLLALDRERVLSLRGLRFQGKILSFYLIHSHQKQLNRIALSGCFEYLFNNMPLF